MKRLLRRGALGLVVLALVIVAFSGVLLYRTLPRVSGLLTVNGLSAPVEVRRDARGIPHITASSADDAYYGLGFVHAQDRFWQMESMRRLATGRLSEVVGPATLDRDRFMRVLGFAGLVARQFQQLDAPVRRALIAYAAGVNAWLDARGWALPPEFIALRYRPEPWQPTDSLLWSKVMALTLSWNWRDKLLRARLIDRLSSEKISQMWPSHPALSPTRTGSAAPVMDALAAALPFPATEPRGASNSWVVAGARTASGKPILANDPHLGFSAPILWYLARLSAPDLDVTGATIPGFPFSILGHNGHIAWGMTSTENNQQDLFVERLSAADKNRYLTPDGTRPFRIRNETITVKGGGEVELTVRETRHGPVLSDVLGSVGAPPGDVIALAAAFLDPDDMTPQAIYRINRARNRREFTAALEEFHTPQMTFTYADTNGNTGFYMPGRVPVRRNGRGQIPAPGWTGEADWVGFIPFRDLPSGFNQADGKFVTANNDITRPGYPHFITDEWGPGYRARRIDELLKKAPTQTMDSTTRIQNDHVSLMARHLLPLMLTVNPDTERERQALALLRAWDGAMSRLRPEPAIFASWLRELNRAVYGDELGPFLNQFWGFRPRFMVSVLTRRQGWCDDVDTDSTETCTDRLSLALETALADLTERLGPDMKGWRWGDLHQARFRHPVFGRLPLVKALATLGIGSDGGPYTINRGATSVAQPITPFDHIHGPGLRAVYDLSDLNRSRFMIATGQSGNPLSPHYRDLLTAWRDGEYLEIPGRPRKGDKVLKLVPENRGG